MKPAASVILLTTLIGAGQGLFLALFTHQSHALFGLARQSAGAALYGAGSLLAAALLAAGLIASFFHLGRPERAWRTAAQWRTSWLSREVIVLPAFMATVLLYAATFLGAPNPEVLRLPGGAGLDASVAIGIAGTALAFALFVCTGMIYACVRFLKEWHTPLTVANYVLLGAASGFAIAALLAAATAPAAAPFFAAWALALTLAAFVSRGASLVRNARLRPTSTLATAIGVRHPRIVQVSQGFTAGSFNTREFFHGRDAAFLRSVKWIFLALAFALPAAAFVAYLASGATVALAIAVASQAAGLIAERWFFFAEANHPQNLYYQAVA